MTVRINLKAYMEVVELLDKRELSFQEFIDLAKDQNKFEALLVNQTFFKALTQRKLLSKEDVTSFIESIEDYGQFYRFLNNSSLKLRLFKYNLIDFQKLIDRCVSLRDHYGHSTITNVFDSSKTVMSTSERMYREGKVSTKDIAYYVNNLMTSYEFDVAVRGNLFVFLHTLENNLLDADSFRRFDKFIQEDRSCLKKVFIDYISDELRVAFMKGSISTLNLDKLLKMPRAIYNRNFSNKQRNALLDIVYSSESARNNFSQLVESDLVGMYDFDQIKELILKDEKKKKIKMNF